MMAVHSPRRDQDEPREGEEQDIAGDVPVERGSEKRTPDPYQAEAETGPQVHPASSQVSRHTDEGSTPDHDERGRRSSVRCLSCSVYKGRHR
jgi:hypothetical protein